VPDEDLADQCIRHYYQIRAPNLTPERWSVVADYTIFELFWVPLNNLPLIVHPQDRWVKWLPIE
jgi:hypothetical protein